VGDGRTVVVLHRLPGDPGGGEPVDVSALVPAGAVTVTDLTPARTSDQRLTTLVDGAVPWPSGDAPTSTILEIGSP
jgi:hypothetical protein